MAHSYLGEGTVISISLEFYILQEELQKDYVWIFKIAVDGEVGYDKYGTNVCNTGKT